MKYKIRAKSFTLIEILVVIAIVGLLSLIVFVSLNRARNKSKDATIIANLGSLKVAGELYADDFGNFKDFCGADLDVVRAIDEIEKLEKTAICRSDDVDGEEWAACASVYDSIAKNWCVDSRGTSKAMPCVTCDATFSLTSCPNCP